MPAPQFLFGPVPHQEAVDFIKSKPVVSRDVFDGLLPEIRGRAFTIAGIEGANVLQSVRDRIADLPAGANWDDVKADIANDISPFMVDPNAEAEERDAQIGAANRRAELLLRTHGFQAYQSAACQVMDRQKDVLPYWQYLTMEDERVRPEHAALDKIVLPADHPFWENHTGPWAFGCRCQRVAISREDHAEILADDAKRPDDGKLVLDSAQGDRLTHGQLIRNGRAFDVRSPVQKEGSSAFQWNWKDLRIPLDQLRARYDAPVWTQFESWARKTVLNDQTDVTAWELAGGKASLGTRIRRVVVSLLNWLKGDPAPKASPDAPIPVKKEKASPPALPIRPKPFIPHKPAKASEREAKKTPSHPTPWMPEGQQITVAEGAGGLMKRVGAKEAARIDAAAKEELARRRESLPTRPPVASLKNTRLGGEYVLGEPFKAGLTQAKRAINQVHYFPPDTSFPSVARGEGDYEMAYNRGANVIKFKGDSNPFVVSHEFGHFIDWKVLGNPHDNVTGNFSRSLGAANLMSAIKQTSPVQAIVRGTGIHRDYLLNPRELFARAYAQYIASRSGDKESLAALKKYLGRRQTKNWQWRDQEFKSIAEQFDLIFKAKGMIP